MVALGNRVLPSSWAVRAAGDPTALARAVQQEVLRVDPDLPVARVMTMDRIIGKSIARQNFNMILLGIFGGVALLLAAIGIYGVMSYTVQQRTHEMGIRIALGAGAGQLLRLVVGHGLLLAGIGVTIGLAASFGVTRLMSSLLVRGEGHRCRHIRRRGCRAFRGRGSGLLHPRAARHPRGPDRRSQTRLAGSRIS